MLYIGVQWSYKYRMLSCDMLSVFATIALAVESRPQNRSLTRSLRTSKLVRFALLSQYLVVPVAVRQMLRRLIIQIDCGSTQTTDLEERSSALL